jgi:hypothetical protein
MLKIIQQLKQQNLPAFSFALAGLVALLFAVTGLALLGQGLIEQKQIAKQVGDLQITGRTIESIVVINRLTGGEEAAFTEFEKSVNSFNHQWTDFKQQHDYSDKTIKEIDTVWQRINSNAQHILSMKKEMMALREAVQNINIIFKPIHKINEELVSVLLSNNAEIKQVVIAKSMSVLLLGLEREIKKDYDGHERAVMSEDAFSFYWSQYNSFLNKLWLEDSNYSIKKIEDVKARELIEHEIILCKKIYMLMDYFNSTMTEVFQFREYHSSIYRDVPELKPALTKLNNHKLNTGLMLLTLCSWLCVFACGYGYVRALQAR